MVSNDACVVSADAGGINDTVCQSVGDIVHTNASLQYSAPMSAVTNRFGQDSISEDKCQSTLCTGDIGFVENEVQLSIFQQTASFSDKLCDINDGLVTSTPKKQCGFFVPPADISISPICKTEFKTTCVTQQLLHIENPSATVDTRKHTRKRRKNKYRTFAEIRDLHKREGLRSTMKVTKSSMITAIFTF